MTAAHDQDEAPYLVERPTLDQLVEVRAYALRLIPDRRTFASWNEIKRTAARLPHIDYAEFRNAVDAAIDQEPLLGDER